MERALILIKPEAVRESRIGQVLAYFDKTGLDLIKLTMLTPSIEMIEEHYPADPDWLKNAGGHWVRTQEELSSEGTPALGMLFSDPVAAGEHLREMLIDNYANQPIVAAIYEGESAIKRARAACGSTDPSQAAAGTVRGDLADDSGRAATAEDRPIQNMVHVSSSVRDAEREIRIWFGNC